MQKLNYFIFILSIFLFTSCVGKKKYINTLSNQLSCEEREFQLNKRLENTNIQLRQLTKENGLLETRIEQLENEKSQKSSMITDLRSKVEDVTGKAMSEQARLDQSLKEKERELEKREKVLNEMNAIRAKNDNAINDMLFKVYDAVGSFTEEELRIEMYNGGILISLYDKIMFNRNSANIRTRGKEALKSLSAAIATHPELEVTVEGNVNTLKGAANGYKDNWDLSVLRAAAVTRQLTTKHDLPATQFTAAGRGNTALKYAEDDQENKYKNDRTELFISPVMNGIYEVLKKGVQ